MGAPVVLMVVDAAIQAREVYGGGEAASVSARRSLVLGGPRGGESEGNRTSVEQPELRQLDYPRKAVAIARPLARAALVVRSASVCGSPPGESSLLGGGARRRMYNRPRTGCHESYERAWLTKADPTPRHSVCVQTTERLLEVGQVQGLCSSYRALRWSGLV